MSEPLAMHDLRKFVVPEIALGKGARFLVGTYLRNLGVRRPVLITDSGLMQAGWASELSDWLAREGFSVVPYDAISANPRSEQIMDGKAFFREADGDSLVALGGGSVIDAAKGIGVVHTNPGDVLDYEGVDEIPHPGVPLIAIPTTAGSSADVSPFAIINHAARKTKVALISKALIPDAALIDPILMTSLDPTLTAHTGLDALSHAFEALASNAASALTDLHAIEAIRLIHTWLRRAYESPTDLVAREKMALASLHAGLAFSNASLGAVHAMAHALGGLLDWPHGLCNAILLPAVIDFNFPAAEQAYARAASALDLDLGPGYAKRLIAAVESLKKDVGITESLSERGLTPEAIPTLARHAVHDPCLLTNPRPADANDLATLFTHAL